MRIATRLARATCLLYLTALTVLLLVPDPAAWLMGVSPDLSVPGRGVHFTAFFLLAVFTAASRLPWRATALAGILVVYAIVIESLQGLVESRVVELLDYTENLLGLAAGAIAWQLGYRLFCGRRPIESTAED